MTRTPQQLKAINPIMARAEVRRSEWEIEAVRAQSFWRKPRYDNLDLVLVVCGLTSIAMTLWGLLS
jgi:hypothetical protein